MIFDEVDRGVGGAVASAIGERLSRLAERSQVLVVTHSPQVAARASHHYRIEKSHGDGGTRTTVRKLVRRRAARGDCENAFRRFDHRGSEGAGLAPARRCVTAYVALIRAVNVAGRKLLMTDLKAIAAKLKLDRARTFIAERQSAVRQREVRGSFEDRARSGARGAYV